MNDHVLEKCSSQVTSSVSMSPDTLDKQMVELGSIHPMVISGYRLHSDVANLTTTLEVLVQKWW